MMQFHVLRFSELADRHGQSWDHLRESNPLYDSPFFCPEFIDAVARVRDDVRVALIEQSDETVGIFPYQLARWGGAGPVGGDFSEFHGPLLQTGYAWDVSALLRGCGLRAWAYDHLPARLEPFARYHHLVGESPFVDLAEGFEAYQRSKRLTRSRLLPQLEQRERKVTRELGELRFESHDASESAFNCLINWKTAQHLRTGVPDVFQLPWVTQLLRQVWRTQTPRFCGMLSVLRAGDVPLAVHLGMRTRHVAHMWYPAYDPQFGRYSPGMLLFLRLARALADRGVRRIDFGPGGQEYKQRLASGTIQVARGVAETSAARHAVRRGLSAAAHWGRTNRWAAPARVPGRLLLNVGRRLTGRIASGVAELSVGSRTSFPKSSRSV